MSKRKRTLLSQYLIIVEGETEQLYFEGLKSLLPRDYAKQVNIKIRKGKPGNPQTKNIKFRYLIFFNYI